MSFDASHVFANKWLEGHILYSPVCNDKEMKQGVTGYCFPLYISCLDMYANVCKKKFPTFPAIPP